MNLEASNNAAWAPSLEVLIELVCSVAWVLGDSNVAEVEAPTPLGLSEEC